MKSSSSAEIKLQVMICTYGRRLLSITPEKLPKIESVGWLISCQDPDAELDGADLRPLMLRPDVDLRIYRDKGLTRNRNHALDVALAPYLLVSDDDLSYNPQGLKDLINAFEDNPKADIILTNCPTPAAYPHPPAKCTISGKFVKHTVCSIEIAIRRKSILPYNIRFSTLAGINAPLLCAGEEELLLKKALNKKAHLLYIPITPAYHFQPTTATKAATKAEYIITKGAIITALRGFLTALTRFPIEATRAHRNWPTAMILLLRGMIYFYTHKKKLL